MSDIPTDSRLTAAMQQACREARLWMGMTSPNPPVGAVALDKNGQILAAAAHKRAGEDHAEMALIKLCHEQNLIQQVHTICVTLEPCNHTGRTPPCCDALIMAEIHRVVVGCRDPNRTVKGGGIERLSHEGIEIVEGIETEACKRLIHAFAFHAATGKPFVTVKRAFDENGSMVPSEKKKTFTSKESLILAHRLRKKADAIVTGSGTILADNPLFTVRHVPDHKGKQRYLAILDRRGRVPHDYIEQAEKRGLDAFIYKDVDRCFSDLTARGVRDILLEAGPLLSRAILGSAHWTMLVDIHKGEPDRVEVSFNENAPIPFDTQNVELETLLPL